MHATLENYQKVLFSKYDTTEEIRTKIKWKRPVCDAMSETKVVSTISALKWQAPSFSIADQYWHKGADI